VATTTGPARNGPLKTPPTEQTGVPERVERTDPEGVDYGRVMQLTFVVTILAGVPLVTVLSLSVELSTWTERAMFAVRVGAVVWVLTALAVYAIERYQSADDE
jgi:transcriptional regulator of nitric oxide reductase